MLDKQIVNLINEQIQAELYSAYLYLDFSNFYYDKGLDGFGNWFMVQTQEERDHAMLFIKYMQNNGCSIDLLPIKKPDVPLNDIGELLYEQLKHEKFVTSLIHNIYEKAYELRDFRTMQFLDWFVKEQGEEENNAETMIHRFEMFGDDKKALYMLNSELGQRVYSAPGLVL